MKVSVVMAVRNGERYLREAIESVLSQSLVDFEFLIVDDHSTDGTAAILRGYGRKDSRIRVLVNRRPLGPFPSANLAISQARGQYVARHDGDDISFPDRLMLQARVLESDPEVCLVTGPVKYFGIGPGQNRTHCPLTWQPRLEWELLFGNAAGTGAHVMFPRVFRGAPVLYPATHAYAEDYWLWSHFSRQGRIVCLPQVLYRYRQHSQSISAMRRHEQDECAAQIRDECLFRHLRPGVSQQTVAEMVRFWKWDGGRPLEESIHRITPVLAELRSGFLTYVERRYGSVDRARLDAEIEEAFRERLRYWLFRSLRFRDAHACRGLLSVSGARRERTRVISGALKHVLRAGLRRVRGTEVIARAGPLRWP
jgi:glycosyltransferase involved in cell wall biosynthesis